ncbi:MAG: hypothetical protein JKY33_01455 [Bacteroidia bacterium]|nr:hypothetical protein [Bacteroidia bacterium]
MRFKEIIGQQEVKDHVIKTVRENRISNTQLFWGSEGTGGLALAIAYAQYLNCLAPLDDDSCGECDSCMKNAKLVHPDLHFSYPFNLPKSDPNSRSTDFLVKWREAVLGNPYLNYHTWLQKLEIENKQGNITALECRDIIKRLSLKPYEGKYKILIMWLPEFLGNEGNILLKLLEEPSSNTVIILVTQDKDRVLNTILSRTQILHINRINDVDIKNALINLHDLTEDEAQRIVFLSEGNYHKAQVLIQDVEDNNQTLFRGWLRLCFERKGGELVSYVNDLAKIGRERQKQFLNYGLSIIRECILINNGVNQIGRVEGDVLDFVQKLSQFVHEANQKEIMEEFNKACFHIERNGNPKIVFLDLSIKMGELLKVENVSLQT